MKYLTNRTEIAKAINIKRYPVIRFDMTKVDDDNFVEGDKVKVFCHSSSGDYYYPAYTYYNNGIISIQKCGAMLSSDFGYNSVIELYENSKLSLINPNQKVIILLDFGSKKGLQLRLMQTDKYCQLKDIE